MTASRHETIVWLRWLNNWVRGEMSPMHVQEESSPPVLTKWIDMKVDGQDDRDAPDISYLMMRWT